MISTLVPDTWYMDGKWIHDDNTIRLYLDYMTQEEYDYVRLNKHKYHQPVQSIIAEYDTTIKFGSFTKLKLREINEQEFNNIKLEKKLKIEKEITAKWLVYKEEQKLERPMAKVDEDCDDAYSAVLKARNLLQSELDKVPVTYVAPSKRNAAPLPEKKVIVNARKELADCELRFEKLKNDIAEADKEWEKENRDAFAAKLVM
jgi:hypothetical protein